MTELEQISLTTFLTVLSGVFVFVSGQLIVEFIIKPYQSYRALRAEISFSLTNFANVGSTILYEDMLGQLEALSGEDRKSYQLQAERIEESIRTEWRRTDEARKLIRQQASQLISSVNSLPFARAWIALRLIPSFQAISEATAALIGYSNTLGNHIGYDYKAVVYKSLNLRMSGDK